MRRLAALIMKQSHQMKELFLSQQENLASSILKEVKQAYLFMKGILQLRNLLKGSSNFSICWISPVKESECLSLSGMGMDKFFCFTKAQTVQFSLFGLCNIIFDHLSKNGRTFEEATTRHLNEYGEAGLRTLALVYRKLEEAEYSAWNEEFLKAKTSISGDKEAMLERVSDMIERDLIILGATAVEDKLQKGVPQYIDKLAQAGLKIWVLTGDKMETAINIGFACSLLRRGMKQICITTNADMLAQDSKEAVKENILLQITNASQMVKLEKDPHAAFALIIDGKTLTYALENDMKHQFLNLAVDCASVICCRVSPRQKALVKYLYSLSNICSEFSHF